jgi:DNA repair protein RecN (Recombination protein N)
VLAFLEDVRSRMEAIETAGERKTKLEQELDQASAAYGERAAALTKARNAAAEKLAKKVETELDSLALENAVFRVELREANWSEDGADRVEFLISANAGEEPRALDKVASGGELSRIALALKTSLGQTGDKNGVQRTLVFDEIDSGIGGSMGHVIGEKLKSLSRSHQVLLITHLPQIAAFAGRQFSISKAAAAGRTHVSVEPVESDKRVREIARMLGGVAQAGEDPTPASLRHASEMLEQAN